ncbi:MAG: hypothetical protein E7372_03550 [Clostridiales bacterium]|nr:hypothetical protein [Clostridiales bacterium]
MVEPIFEKISYEQKLPEVAHQVKVDCKSNLVSEEIASILVVSPFVSVDSSEILDAKAKINGRINFYITYIDKEGNIKKGECGAEFGGEADLTDGYDDAKAKLSVCVQKVEYDLNGIYLVVSAILSASIKLTKLIEKSALVGGEDLYTNQCEFCSMQNLGKRTGAYPIEEEFDLNYPVEEVLYHKAQAVITATQCGVGSIIVDGEVLLSLVLLQKNEKKDIIKETRLLPFRMEIESEEAMPNMLATASVKEKSFKTDVGVDEDNGSSVVVAHVSLMFEGEAYNEVNKMIVQDVFSTQREIEIIKEVCEQTYPLESRNYSFAVSGMAGIGELPIGATAPVVCMESINILESSVTAKGLFVTATYGGSIYFKDGDKVISRKFEMPFEKEIAGEFDESTILECEAKAFKGQAKIVSSTEVDIDGEVYLSLSLFKKCQTKLVSDIKFLEEKQENDSAISVYLAIKDEEQFSLAKRLNVCPEKLIETNKDLQFPLSGNERIVVYRQK